MPLQTLCRRFKPVVRKRSPLLAAPPLAEWSFDHCPAKELPTCRKYEFTRESPLIRETVERKRNGELDALTESVFMLFPYTSYWILDSPWWHKTPYLGIPTEELRRLYPEPKQGKTNLADLVDLDVNPGPKASERIVLIYIPEGLSRSLARRSINDLLTRDYAHLFKSESVGWRPKRGRGSYTGQFKADLKALGALRLRKAGYSALAAIELAKSLRLDTYLTVQAYCRAVKRAQALIDYFEDLLRQFAAKKALQ
jgi:hypothetical protein